MPFGTITAQTQTYDPRSPGIYTRTSVGLGQPDNSFVIRPASSKADPLRASVSRVIQKDVVVGGSTVRKTATVTVSCVVPSADFTSTEVDSLVADISEFITATSITRILQGES